MNAKQNVQFGDTAITGIDGSLGTLCYRGYRIEDVVRHLDYESTISFCFVLITVTVSRHVYLSRRCKAEGQHHILMAVLHYSLTVPKRPPPTVSFRQVNQSSDCNNPIVEINNAPSYFRAKIAALSMAPMMQTAMRALREKFSIRPRTVLRKTVFRSDNALTSCLRDLRTARRFG